ncbi:DNA-binding protein [Marinagarivorans algicola]|uniref:DNA-binding protein n=1 Tax=Marinagarivorans algicola TaxID=1513270 RepID=UPI003735D465
MARGGINKALVKQAREALIGKGQNPSIDAVRVALGNTGSKSTIHRYLRELEEENATALDNQARLSQPIQELVGQLASRLKEEAQTAIEEDKKHYDLKISTLMAKIEEQQGMITRASKQAASQDEALRSALTHIERHKENEETLKASLTKAAQSNAKLQAMLEEKQNHIHSLEEKHQHNREAMAHYRQSVKEQREQDQRQQEQYTQQLHAEIRTLNQVVSLKQADITQLNKDNGRLAAERVTAQKTEREREAAYLNAQSLLDTQLSKCQTLEGQLAQLRTHTHTQSIEIKKLKETVTPLQAWKEDKQIHLAKLEAEVAVKTQIVEQLISERGEKDQPPSAHPTSQKADTQKTNNST